MKIFISWSGNQSKAIAEALRDWLPEVIQRIDPWISCDDIDKGARWNKEIGEQLNSATFGIICLTPDNKEAPWILFEAGALSKSLEHSHVCPYLYKLKPADVKEPLSQFQATVANKEDTFKLLQSINKMFENESLNETQLKKAFERCWPEFDTKLQSVLTMTKTENIHRSDREILEEILSLVRNLNRGQEFQVNWLNKDELLNILLGKSATKDSTQLQLNGFFPQKVKEDKGHVKEDTDMFKKVKLPTK